MNENLKPTSAESYLKKRAGTKSVKVPSGDTFIIGKMTGRDFVNRGGLMLVTISQVRQGQSTEERKEILDKMSEEDRKKQIELYNKMLVLAVREPKISLTEEPNAIPIDKLTDEDYYKLLQEIFEFSLPGGEEDVSKFRKDT